MKKVSVCKQLQLKTQKKGINNYCHLSWVLYCCMLKYAHIKDKLDPDKDIYKQSVTYVICYCSQFYFFHRELYSKCSSRWYLWFTFWGLYMWFRKWNICVMFMWLWRSIIKLSRYVDTGSAIMFKRCMIVTVTGWLHTCGKYSYIHTYPFSQK